MSETMEQRMQRIQGEERVSPRQPTVETSSPIIAKDEVLFNPNLLPDGVKQFAVDIADRMNNAPVAFSAITTLVVLSAAIGRRVGVRPKLHDDWTVIPNLWGALIAPPSIKKTPIYSEAIKPLVKAEAEANEEYKKEMQEYSAEMLDYKIALDKYKKEAAKSEKATVPTAPELPTRKRFVSQDTTIEALAQIMIENPNGILLTVDELSGWFTTLKKAGREGDRAFYLEAFNGNGSKSIDRVGRGSSYVPHVCASVFGTIQPDSLSPLIVSTRSGGSGGDGLLQRFQLVAIVKQNDFKYVDREPNYEARTQYHKSVEQLVNANPIDYSANTDEYNGDIYYRFSPSANGIFKEWAIKLNKKIEAEAEHNPALSAHLGKFEGLFASIALILFYSDRTANRVTTSTIPEEYATKALQWCDFLEVQAREVYDIERIAEDRRTALDEKIFDKVKELQLLGQLPLSFGKIAEKIRGASAKNVEETLKGSAVVKARKVFGLP